MRTPLGSVICGCALVMYPLQLAVLAMIIFLFYIPNGAMLTALKINLVCAVLGAPGFVLAIRYFYLTRKRHE